MPIVTTQAGQLRGTREGPLAVFRGIPYAAPPVGERRWRAPTATAGWAGVRDATAFGPACLQKVAGQEPERSLKDGPQGEDCLTLNVWAPADAARKAPLPVMVWIHGGSFRFGAGSLASYDGSELAKRGVIVVTINYRLGLFGTFAHPALARSDEPGGNYGLLDAIAALHWVRDNIAGFGGDPRAVTLFGESAGGVSVGYLLASPLAKGLFHRAIMESGGLSLPEYSRPQAEGIAEKAAGSWHAQTADALRAVSATAIRDTDTASADIMPFVDGTIVREKARAAFESGRIQHVPLLIGYNDAEAGFFGARYWQSLPGEVDADAWRTLRGRCFGYGSKDDGACAEQVASERFAGVNTRAMQRGASAFVPVYAYRFAWVPPSARATTRGAIHTAEIGYVFGHVAVDPAADARSRIVSRALADRWAAFARTGSPALKNGDWPRFVKQSNEKLLLIGLDAEAMGPNKADALLDTIDDMAMPPRP
jgi:para-nitrobenzyl esterase